MPSNTESDRDRDDAVREYLDAQRDEDTADADKEAQIAQLRDENAELRAEVQDLRDELHGWESTVKELSSRVNELGGKIDGDDPSDPRANGYYEDLSRLEKYAEMPDEERADLLNGSTAKQRAVLIFENWSDWSQAGARDSSERFISTNRTRGQHGKTAIKIDLEQETGEDLQSNDVYRAMRMVAKLATADRDDVDVVTDEYGRKHITGGAFEYHEKVNSDAGGQGRKFKVLKLVNEEAVILP